ncbi:MAG: ATP-binding protein [Eggerthellaceae bacterium]|nr:ATP-binding protein [Eggerthellaceae bacterium]
MVTRNPFTPSFGIVPDYLAGRDRVLAEMARAFENGLGDPNLATVIVGPRGSGKTALLACIGDSARDAGWLVVDTIAASGMLEDILQQSAAEASGLVEPKPEKRLTGITVGQLIGFEWAVEDAGQANWRTRMSALLDVLGEHDVGLLITVDEIDPAVDELVQLASIYQLFVRERRNVALVMAGLPKNATDLVDDDRVTFLRRARKRFLNRIADADARRAFRQSFEATGKEIADDLLEKLVDAADGFPYMMQLVGFNVWAESFGKTTVTSEHVERGLTAAREEFTENVLKSTVRDMSKGDLAFARAMVDCGEACTISEVARRMGKGANYASTYKARLLKQGVLTEHDDKTFSFAIPLFREYLAK